MITGGDKLDINFVDGEYSIYHSRSLNAKPTKQIYVPIILTTNTIHSAEEDARRRMNYVMTEQRGEPWKMHETIIGFVHY